MSSSWNFHSSIYKYLPLCCNVNAIKHHRHTRIAIFHCSVSLLLCIYMNKSIEGFAKAGDMFHPGDHLLLCDVSPDEKESPLVSPPQNWEGGSPAGMRGGLVPAAGNPGYRTQDCHSHSPSRPSSPRPLQLKEKWQTAWSRISTELLLSWKMFQGKTTSSEKNNIFGSNVKAWMPELNVSVRKKTEVADFEPILQFCISKIHICKNTYRKY